MTLVFSLSHSCPKMGPLMAQHIVQAVSSLLQQKTGRLATQQGLAFQPDLLCWRLAQLQLYFYLEFQDRYWLIDEAGTC